jgi:hypothetical protein
LHIIRNDFGRKIKSFEFDYLGGHSGIEAVLMNATVSLYEKGLHISTGLSRDNIFLEWKRISGLKISQGKHRLIDINYDAGRIQLQEVKKEAELNEFVEIIKKANPALEIEYIKTDKSKISDINTKRQEKRYQEQERRVQVFIASLETDEEDEIIRAWEERLKENLEFPFEAETVDNPGPLQVGKTVKVTGLDGSEDLYGIIAVIKDGRKKYWLPLCELVPVDKGSENYQMIDDYCFWFCSR